MQSPWAQAPPIQQQQQAQHRARAPLESADSDEEEEEEEDGEEEDEEEPLSFWEDAARVAKKNPHPPPPAAAARPGLSQPGPPPHQNPGGGSGNTHKRRSDKDEVGGEITACPVTRPHSSDYLWTTPSYVCVHVLSFCLWTCMVTLVFYFVSVLCCRRIFAACSPVTMPVRSLTAGARENCASSTPTLTVSPSCGSMHYSRKCTCVYMYCMYMYSVHVCSS